MKRIICIFAALCLLMGSTAHAAPLSDDDISLASPSALLMEKLTGEIMYEKNAHERLSPASITKIMTMLLIVEDIESGKVALEDTVTASSRAASFGGSCVFLEAGEQMSVGEMLKCIAVVSANDCAVAMAEHLNGSEELFVERMNQRAKELGMENSSFTNCTGLFDSKEHYTTAYDVALMARELISHELIKDYSTIWMDSIRGGEFELSNTNRLVAHYEGCTGLKTGYTSAAKYCLAATAERDGAEYIAVIMHSESVASRNGDAETLLNYAFANFSLCPLRPDFEAGKVRVELGQKDWVEAVYSGAEYALVPKTNAKPEYHLSLAESVSAPVKAGDRLGTLSVSLGGSEAAQVALCAGEDVPGLGFWGFWLRLAGSLLGL